MTRELMTAAWRARARRFALALTGLLVMSTPSVAVAGKADVVGAKVTREAGGSFRFSVTVRHHDEGWEHYANTWEVVAPDGTVLGTRVLLHPHETEQPFTRSLGGVTVPAGIDEVTIRALDLRHGAGGKEMSIKVPR